MIRFQITGSNPIEMNIAAKVLTEHSRLDVETDSGNRNGRKQGYIRYVNTRIKRKAGRPKPKPKPRLDGAQKMSLAQQCHDHIIYKTDEESEALEAIIKLIEYVEKVYR